MKKLFVALLAAIAIPAAVSCAPKQNIDDGNFIPRGEFRLKGWFYADAVVTDTNPDEEPEIVYEGAIAFKVTHGPSGEHTYFGALCGPREDWLECEPEPVAELPYGPSYPITTTIIGSADENNAQFDVASDISGSVYERNWTITGVTTEAPEGDALRVEAPSFKRDLEDIIAQE